MAVMKIITAIFLSLRGPKGAEAIPWDCFAAPAMTVLTIFLLCANTYAFTANGFSNPYGVVVDQKSGLIYVSNVNGDLLSKDDNGFISRLKADGSVDQLRFIDGAASDIILHAPKGMAILGNFLYVCDIDALHSYYLTTGKQLFDVNFGDLPHQSFYSIVVGPDGALYVADEGINTIYRIDISKQHEVTAFNAGPDLGGPHGIAWFPGRQVFVVTGNQSGEITAYDKSGKRQQIPTIFLKTPEGLDVDDGGNIYVASRDLNSVYRIAPTFGLFGFQVGLTTPAGVAYHRASKSIIVTSFGNNTVQSFSLTP